MWWENGPEETLAEFTRVIESDMAQKADAEMYAEIIRGGMVPPTFLEALGTLPINPETGNPDPSLEEALAIGALISDYLDGRLALLEIEMPKPETDQDPLIWLKMMFEANGGIFTLEFDNGPAVGWNEPIHMTTGSPSEADPMEIDPTMISADPPEYPLPLFLGPQNLFSSFTELRSFLGMARWLIESQSLVVLYRPKGSYLEQLLEDMEKVGGIPEIPKDPDTN